MRRQARGLNERTTATRAGWPELKAGISHAGEEYWKSEIRDTQSTVTYLSDLHHSVQKGRLRKYG